MEENIPAPHGATCLEALVYPSNEPTIASFDEADGSPGAHLYTLRQSRGFENGEPVYEDAYTLFVPFVHKRINDDHGGTDITAGLQSEQLAYILLDRCEKLNARFPSDQHARMVTGLKMFLDACRERIEDRISRGVMGELKK